MLLFTALDMDLKHNFTVGAKSEVLLSSMPASRLECKESRA